jgi:uncharacterized protein (TIGR03492 family)
MGKRVLFLSNGHGEDLNASVIIKALRHMAPEVEVAALPIVGAGQAYQRLGVQIIGPTQQLPSGGFSYISVARLLNPLHWGRDANPINLVRDLFAGLMTLTWGQLQAVRQFGPGCDLLLVTGDVVPILFAWITGRPFMVFLVSTSSYYEGQIKLPWLAYLGLRSPRCQAVFTRDAYTASDLRRRGMTKAQFCGYPIMDVLKPTGKSLQLRENQPVVALLPGSRLPEALENLGLLLKLCALADQHAPLQYVAALVPSMDEGQLAALAMAEGWVHHPNQALTRGSVTVYYYRDAFADILHCCDLVLGMAGTAVEQSVGLGKPVVQIIGQGPQFTYPFADAQMRLLGESVVTIGKRVPTLDLLQQAARTVHQTLNDAVYLERCRQNGLERVGQPGGAEALAKQICHQLGITEPSPESDPEDSLTDRPLGIPR